MEAVASLEQVLHRSTASNLGPSFPLHLIAMVKGNSVGKYGNEGGLRAGHRFLQRLRGVWPDFEQGCRQAGMSGIGYG